MKINIERRKKKESMAIGSEKPMLNINIDNQPIKNKHIQVFSNTTH